MSQKFEDIKVDGAFIREITLVPSKSIRMTLLRAPQSESEEQVTVLSELQFHEVRSCRANFQAEPWLEIKSHDSPAESHYLAHYLARERETADAEVSQSSSTWRVLRIICDEGEIAVIAETFTISVLEEMPHLGPSEPHS